MAGFFLKTKSDGKIQGPFSSDQLKKFASQGKLKSSHLVSKDQQMWHNASSINGLSFNLENVELGVTQETTKPSSIPNGEEKTDDQKQILEQLKQAYQDFYNALSPITGIFLGLWLVAIISGIILGFTISWLIGILGGIVLCFFIGVALSWINARPKKRAKERVSELENLYALSHQQSFDLFSPTRSAFHADGGKGLWEIFVREVWGSSTLAEVQKLAKEAQKLAEALEPVIQTIVHSDDSDERRLAAQTLAQNGNEQSLRGLLSALCNPISYSCRIDADDDYYSGTVYETDYLVEAIEQFGSQALRPLSELLLRPDITGEVSMKTIADLRIRPSVIGEEALKAMSRIDPSWPSSSLGDDVFQMLATALDKKQGLSYEDAACRLSELMHERSLDLLLKAITHENPVVRINTAKGLGNYKDDRAIAALVRATDCRFCQTEAKESLRNIRGVSKLEKLIPFLSHNDEQKRNGAILAAGTTGCKDTIPTLLELLNHDVISTRAAAAKAIGQIGHFKHEPHLTPLLADSESCVRKAAQTAIDLLWARA